MFNLIMRQSECVNNKIAFDSSTAFVYDNHYGSDILADVEYMIGDNTVIINPKYSTTISTNTCPLEAYLYILDEATNEWIES